MFAVACLVLSGEIMNKTLPSAQRPFLQTVADLMFSNPFDHEVSEIEALTGLSLGEGSTEHFYVLLKPKLESVMTTLAQQGINGLPDLAGSDDRHLYMAANLFLIYDRYIDDLDALIAQQIKEPERRLKVKFSKSAFQDLAQLGLDHTQSEKYFALFYQLRRAYLFISRELTGNAACIKRLRRDLWNNVFTSDALLYVNNLWSRMEDFSTLLLGETGTGKGAAAKAIGCSGLIPFDVESQTFKAKFTESFVAINLLEYPEGLLESELFGHTKGAFTGAISQYDGLFKRCNAHGALFLDEIGDINISIQIKLLKVLQERRFSPVGAHDICRFSGRVIAATNRNLNELREAGDFRHDFYYRLSSDVIELPTLRERLEQDPNELGLLIESLMERLTGQPSPAMAGDVLEKLRHSIPADYSWPGNVRELEQAVRRTVLGRAYTGEFIPREKLPVWVESAMAGGLSANELLSAYCSSLYREEGTYEKVAAITGLDRRTVKKYISVAL